MKRLFAMASLVLVFASCDNSGGNAADDIKDSLDSIKNLKIESVNEAAEAAKDTIQERHDSLNKAIDKVADRAADSINQIKK
jgi:cellobiose-specific phosphotransferase system component IIA